MLKKIEKTRKKAIQITEVQKFNQERARRLEDMRYKEEQDVRYK